jgi:hypothetical protein
MRAITELEKEILALSPAERERLAMVAWESLVSDPNPAGNRKIDPEGIQRVKVPVPNSQNRIQRRHHHQHPKPEHRLLQVIRTNLLTALTVIGKKAGRVSLDVRY